MAHAESTIARVAAWDDAWSGTRRRPAREASCRDVLILTSSTGGGHDSVATALRDALHARAPAANVRTLDPLSRGRRDGLWSPGRWYDAAVAQAPWIWGLFYHATNNAWAVRLGMAGGALLWARRLRSAILTEHPGLVVSVHPLCTRLAAAVLRTVPDAPPLHCVVTDLVTIHRCWACADVDAFYAATAEAYDALSAMGIPRERIHVTGLPLRAPFTRTPRVPADAAVPRVLLLGGGRPARRMERVARALAASRQPVRLVVVCGRNARLRRRLTRALGGRAAVLGWCNDNAIAALIRWSSVVITRGGPTTLAEALSQARPVVIYQALPGQEQGNVTLVTRLGAGRYIPDVAALVQAVTRRPCSEAANSASEALWRGSAQRVAARLVLAQARHAGMRSAARSAPRR